MDTDERPQNRWQAARTFHLLGGCRATNGFGPPVDFFPTSVDGKAASFQSRGYEFIYAELASLDVPIIGVDFVSHIFEAKGLMPKNWRTYHDSKSNQVWACQDEIDRWAQIAYAAGKQRNGVLWDLARRVSHQLRVCAWRLHEVSEAYKNQLSARVADKPFKVGERFEDGFTWLGYLTVQVFLVDACVLRDYLAEFYALYALPAGCTVTTRITSMGRLKQRVLTKNVFSDRLFRDLQASTLPNGWLHLLGSYRDLVIHCVPLARAGPKLVAVTTSLPIKNGRPLASVSLPLPADPAGIASSRASPNNHERLEEELQLLSNATRGEVPSTDALVYCYVVLDSLTRLVARLGDHSPVAPEIPHLTKEDIIGEIVVRNHGT